MNYIVYCVLFGVVMLGMVVAGVWLVVSEHYGWAWLPWLGVFGLRFSPPSHPDIHSDAK